MIRASILSGRRLHNLVRACFLHPMFLCGEPRLADYDLVNAIGRLADTSIAVSRLLFSGHLLKFPGMKLVLSHGGAALPYALGRLARNFTVAQGKYADPRKGFEALYFDSCRVRPRRARIPRRRRPGPGASCSAPTCRFRSATRNRRRSCARRGFWRARGRPFSAMRRRACSACGPTAGAGAERAILAARRRRGNPQRRACVPSGAGRTRIKSIVRRFALRCGRIRAHGAWLPRSARSHGNAR